MQNSGGIICKNITRKFGHLTALNKINLRIETGDFMALFGPNGAGKTTLLKILCGLLRPSSGEATVAGESVRETDIRKRVGVISHNSFLYDHLTAWENLVFYAEMYGVENAGHRADELLRSVELYHRRDDFARTFSRGMAQRLSIARALVSDPEFIFLDEPFTGLDVHSAGIFRNLLLGLHRRGKTVMMITHDIEIGFTLASRAAIIRKGKLVYNEETHGLAVADLKNAYLENVGR